MNDSAVQRPGICVDIGLSAANMRGYTTLTSRTTNLALSALPFPLLSLLLVAKSEILNNGYASRGERMA
jgi:hypothetical protein